MHRVSHLAVCKPSFFSRERRAEPYRHDHALIVLDGGLYFMGPVSKHFLVGRGRTKVPKCFSFLLREWNIGALSPPFPLLA